MVKPRYRSRTMRRIYVRTPSAQVTIQYKRRRNAAPQCAKCQAVLPGVARGTKTQVHKLNRSARRPERPFGGMLCSACTRRTFIARARALPTA